MSDEHIQKHMESIMCGFVAAMQHTVNAFARFADAANNPEIAREIRIAIQLEEAAAEFEFAMLLIE